MINQKEEEQQNLQDEKQKKQGGDSSQQESDSMESKQLQQMQQFHSDQSWAELDQLEQHLFNGSYEEQTPETQPKKPKKKQQQATKMLEIQQEQKWLQKFRASKLKQYHDPFQKQQLCINKKKVIKSLQEVINNTASINPITKMMGIKPVKILNKWKINEEFQFFINYIENGEIPENFVENFQEQLSRCRQLEAAPKCQEE